MAKSSLTFLERRKVLVLGSSADHAVRTLTKQDCGKIIVLTNPQAHAITLPTAAEAGEGWNCRFILGTLHNDRSVRDLTTIAAQGTETVNLVATKAGGSLTSGVKSQSVNIFDTGRNGGIVTQEGSAAALEDENFTITVPVSMGGSGTTFTFKFKNTAGLTASNSAAGEFEIDAQGIADDPAIAAQIIAIINGDPIDGTHTRVPATGEGSTQTDGIKGLLAAAGDATDQVTLTADNFGAATIPLTIVTGHADAVCKIFGEADSTNVGLLGTAQTAGADRTGVSLSTRTIQITEGATAGDQVEVVVVNGQWQAKSYRAE